MSTVSIGDNTIDSRDIESRIDELRDELADTPFADSDHDHDVLKRVQDETPDEVKACFENWDEDPIEELLGLLEFKEAAEPCTSEWSYGATFIRDSYFQTYAEELADEIGAVDRNASWPTSCIDWEQAANELKQDYSTFTVGSLTYHTRG